MKRLLFFICTILCANVLMAQTRFWIGDIEYEITSTSPAEVKVYDANSSIIIANIPETVSYDGINYSVTAIGEEAFYFFNSLTSVTIPNSVTSIGDRAFMDCYILTSVNIPNSVTSIGENAFYWCGSLTSVTIPNSVTSIGGGAFYHCSSLTSVTIPNSVTSIGYDAFRLCYNLTSVTIGNGVTSIGNNAFENCSSLTSVSIGNSVTSIGEEAFYFCINLTSIDIPNSVTSIGDWAFKDCRGLTSVTCLAETAPSLGESVFSSTPSTKVLNIPCGRDYSSWESATTWASVECTWNLGNGLTYFPLTFAIISEEERTMKVSDCDESATDVEIPETVSYEGTTYSVTAIGEDAFRNCRSLTTVTIPNGVTTIGERAFCVCISLTSVTIPNSVTSIGERAFDACISLTTVTIPNSVTYIGNSAFYECSSLTSVTIPNSVTSIGGWAFSYCDSLTSVTIPNSVTSIGDYAFQLCSSLTSVTIPNSVTSIGGGAFSLCRSLTSVILPNNANISSSAFRKTGGINVGGIYYGCEETVNIGNYTFNNVGFIKFYLNGNATTITPSEVSVIDCNESLNGDIVISSILNYEGINYSVTSIGDYAFEDCSSLTSVTIPNSVTSIGYAAFFDCVSLTSINIPNSVTSIGDWAFALCDDLTSVTIPNSVTSIGSYAFRDCSSLDSVICLAETAPSLDGSSVFYATPSTKVLNIPFGSDYSSWQGATTWSKTNYLIQEGETKELSNDFTINSTTGLINQGVLRIKQSGQLINQTGTNVSGIFEVETPTLANDKWSFIGAPFNNYKLEAVKPGTKDISISLFDYETGNWSNDFATIEDEVGAGEGFFAWSFAAEPTVFTTYGDGAEEYNFENTPEYALNNGAVTVTKNLTTHADGGNWLALSNPYTFKLDVNKFLSDHGDIKGGEVYRFNGSVWTPVSEGEINMTEGFFVNFEDPGTHSVSFSKLYIYEPAKSKAIEAKDYITLNLTEGENVSKLRFAQNPKAKQGDDLFDANKLFSPLEITEPYFVTDGVALVKEEVNTLPYTANLNIRNYETKEVTISIDNIPEGVTVFLLDNGQDIKMNRGVEYTTTITAGENADRFQLLVKKQQKIERNTNNQITIKNNNRQITITSDITNLNIEVYNNLGQKVFATKDYNFTLDQLPSGSYVVKAFYGRVNQSQKIVIE